MTGILGKKLGMTQVFAADGTVVPVTVIEVKPGCVVEVKTREKHGYEAVKVGFFEEPKERRFTKSLAGMFRKAGVAMYRKLKEYPMEGLAVGDKVTVERFQKGDKVAVSGVSKGKGFQGAMKRHHFAGGVASHGSMFNRAIGSAGSASTFPARVFKGQRMPGHMGAHGVTVKNLEVVDVRAEQGLILLRGAVPGAKNSIVEIEKKD